MLLNILFIIEIDFDVSATSEFVKIMRFSIFVCAILTTLRRAKSRICDVVSDAGTLGFTTRNSASSCSSGQHSRLPRSYVRYSRMKVQDFRRTRRNVRDKTTTVVNEKKGLCTKNRTGGDSLGNYRITWGNILP